MPELPEVQTVCSVIGPQIKGKRIRDVRIYGAHVLSCDLHRFEENVCGQRFEALDRRGKYLIFSLESGKQLVMHLRMTGCLLVVPAEAVAEKHTQAVFTLDDGKQLRLIDQRKFARIDLLEPGETLPGIAKLGPEPFDSCITAAYLQSEIGVSGRTVKDCLLDQTVVAGIGNIYSDEILHAAGIHPARRAKSLSMEEYERLARTVPRVMAYFVQMNAISPEKYLLTGGREYQNTPYLRVYGRAGKACLSCGTILVKERISGRGSVYCPACQTIHEVNV